MKPGSGRVWSAMMILFLIALLSFRDAAVLLVGGQQTEVNTNIDGTSSVTRSSSSSAITNNQTPKSLQVTFRNDYDTKIYLFWRREDGSSSLMGPIETGSDSSINTSQGHVFFACFDQNGSNRSLPYEVGKVVYHKSQMIPSNKTFSLLYSSRRLTTMMYTSSEAMHLSRTGNSQRAWYNCSS